jgi:simple sugar transport system ATP-binding protein
MAFDLRAGEVHCLAGENGCGKSTLIKIVTGVYSPEPGAGIEVFGQAVSRMTPETARRSGIAVIWQDLALFPEMSVAENIAFETLLGRGPRPVRHGRLQEAARAALARLNVALDLEARVRVLPIAERQIVAIARALVQDARIIFMDEPTASLTQSETDKLLGIVRNLAAKGVAVVFVSHRLHEVLEVCERVTVLRDGKLVGVFPTQGMTPARLTELMTGKTFDISVAARDLSGAPPVLEVQGLTRSGEFEDITLTVSAGEVVGLTGLIGAGRTELGHALFGMRRPDQGSIRLDGREVRFRSNRDAVDAGVAYVSEDRLALGLIQPQSIADNVVISVLKRITGRAGLISGRVKADLVGHWIRELAIKVGRPEDSVATLSGGNQQRVVLAKWLATEPKLLILDSPTVGVDVGARAGIFRIVRMLAEQGLAILMISDELPEVHQNADRVLHMANGRIVGTYDPRSTELHRLEEAVYG